MKSLDEAGVRCFDYCSRTWISEGGSDGINRKGPKVRVLHEVVKGRSSL